MTKKTLHTSPKTSRRTIALPPKRDHLSSCSFAKTAIATNVFCGDCLHVIPKRIRTNSVDLIFTSPPYADRRKKIYGGLSPSNYVEWFLPRAAIFQKCLKPEGSFVLNIKEPAVNGERHTYVLELILALRQQGWRWVEEYCWHKKNCYPGKWPNRFRDSWERLLHFTLNKNFKMRQEEVRIPMGDWKNNRLKSISETDQMRDISRTGNNFGKRVANWVGRDYAYPTNVLHYSTECSYKNHPATFPIALPDWFIRLFTDQGDLVLDPFAGSGTTLIAAKKLNRHSIGIDTEAEYCRIMRKTLRNKNYKPVQ